MPKTAKYYIGINVAFGFALLAATLIWFSQSPDVARYLACLSLACIASTMKVRLPGLHGTISVNFVFILMAVTQFSLGETLSTLETDDASEDATGAVQRLHGHDQHGAGVCGRARRARTRSHVDRTCSSGDHLLRDEHRDGFSGTGPAF